MGSSTLTTTATVKKDRVGEQPSDSVRAFVPVSASGAGSGTAVETPFVPDRAARPGLAPGQWDPALGGAVQVEAAKRSYLEGMYYCIGTVPKNGLQKDKIYSAYVMGTRVAYWKGALLRCSGENVSLQCSRCNFGLACINLLPQFFQICRKGCSLPSFIPPLLQAKMGQ